MKNILFINTALSKKCVALKTESQVLFKDTTGYKKDLENTLSAIDQLCTQVNLTLNDLDTIVCVAGPGNFSAIRVGFIIAKTLSSQIDNCELLAIDSLSVLEFVNSENGKSAMNASKSEIYSLSDSQIILSQFNHSDLESDTVYDFDERFCQHNKIDEIKLLSHTDLENFVRDSKFINFIKRHKQSNIEEPIYIKEPNIHVKD